MPTMASQWAMLKSARRESCSRESGLLRSSFIDIPTLQDPFIELSTDHYRYELQISQLDKFVRRIFNRGSFSKGGC
jgi:hypothetical protein